MEIYFLVYPISEDWQQVAWCQCAGDTPSKVAQGTLETLAALAKETPIVAVLPGIWLSMFRVTLPKGRGAQVKKALPFLLEEQLAEEVENVHIALPTAYQLGESVSLAVISKKRMQIFFDAFKMRALNLQQALPDWLCLPLYTDTWTVFLNQDHAFVRQGLSSGFSVQKKLLMPMLNLALAQATQKPQALHVYHLALEAADMEEQLATLDIPLAYEAVNQEPIALWAQHFTPPTKLNLLQGEFFVRPKISAVKRLWHMIAGVAGAIILAQVLYASLLYQQLQKQYNTVHAQVMDLYQSVFPEGKEGDNIRSRMEPLLKNSGSMDNALFMYLQDVSEPLMGAADVSLQQVSLRGDGLHLEVIAKDFAVLGQLEAALSAKGLNVKQENASLENERVMAQLQVTR